MTITLSVRRTQTRTNSASFGLNAQSDPTDQFVTGSGTTAITVTLANPTSPSAPISDDYDGSWFRITNASSGSLAVKGGSTPITTVLTNCWAEFIWVAGAPGAWLISARGAL